MKPKSLIMFFLVIFLISCSSTTSPSATLTIDPQYEHTSTPTATEKPTATLVPSTQTPTETNTPEPTPTSTLMPTETLTPEPLVLAEFSAEMIGIGTHGNMTCLSYTGNQGDLEGVTLKANFSQLGKVTDRNVPAEQVDGKTCFENTDFLYIPDLPVVAEITASAKGETTLKNSTQENQLGNYQTVPFIPPILPHLGQLTVHNHAEPKYSEGLSCEAYDLWNGPDEGSPGSGMPIFMPGEMRVLYFGADLGSGVNGNPDNYRLIFSLPDVGLNCAFMHIQPSENTIQMYRTYSYDPNLVVAVTGPKDRYSGTSHLHFECQNPEFFTSNSDVWNGFAYNREDKCGSQILVDIAKYLIDGWLK